MENFVADSIFIDSPPERVYGALLDPADIRVWLDAEEVTVEPKVGGQFFARREDGTTVSGLLRTLAPHERIEIGEYFWESAGNRRGPMEVRFLLEPRMGGVWITVRQDRLDCGKDWKPFARAMREHWVQATLAMKRHIDEI